MRLVRETEPVRQLRRTEPVNSPVLRETEPVRLLRDSEPVTLLSKDVNRPSQYLALGVYEHRTDYGNFEPVKNVCKIFNTFSHFLDAGISIDSFRAKVKAMELEIKLNGIMESCDRNTSQQTALLFRKCCSSEN